MALAPPHLPLRISGVYTGDRPPSGSGSDRGRANAGETAECIDLAAPGLAPRQCVASPGLAIADAVCSPLRHTHVVRPPPPPSSTPFPTQAARKLAIEVLAYARRQLPRLLRNAAGGPLPPTAPRRSTRAGAAKSTSVPGTHWRTGLPPPGSGAPPRPKPASMGAPRAAALRSSSLGGGGGNLDQAGSSGKLKYA
jgi:hypothetical protein